MQIKRYLAWLVCTLGVAACAPHKPQTEVLEVSASAGASAQFKWFAYRGDDEVFNTPLADDEYRNPILAGFYPDPSVVRVEHDYYMVHSTFGFFPGLPIFHSRDLVTWTQIGNAIHRAEQMRFDGLPLANAGLYAPAIEHRKGVFYVINTCVGCGGNFVVTATDPRGPWSQPIWLPHIWGIDPSIFFDDDGKTYVVHHAEPPQKRYPAHTAINVMEVDPQTFQPRSADVLLIDGGDDWPWNTDYLEGPHIYKVDGFYYLSAAGGGTGYHHQQLLFRSKSVFGPYTANPNNPVLTQHGLPDDRPHPVTATGHADLFTDTNGKWWAVFLATRVYDLATPPQDPGNFHTGRETFMLPVQWQAGWPVILQPGVPMPFAVQKPDLPAAPRSAKPTTGNFSWRETFTDDTLGPQWLFVRTPHNPWWQSGGGSLTLQARTDHVGANAQPSFVGQRVAHMRASATTEVLFIANAPGAEAGLLALQTDDYFYAFGISANAAGQPVLRIRKKAGAQYATRGETVKEQIVSLPRNASIVLRMTIDKAELDFTYSTDGKHFKTLLAKADARVLTTARAGGFVGAVVGMYAEAAQVAVQ